MPEIDIRIPKRSMKENVLPEIRRGHDVDMWRLAYALREGLIPGIKITAYLQRLEYFGDLYIARSYIATISYNS